LALLEELSGELGRDRVESLMLAAGRRLALTAARRAGSLEERVNEAAGLLNELGGDVSVVPHATGFRLTSSGCPLSAAVARRPETCRAMQGLLDAVIGVPVSQCCDQGARPRCCFTISTAA
jgi:predicted ArsR family transcriptional regulator